MSSLAVRIVGVGDAFTSRYHHACLLVELEDSRLLIDAPPALGRALADCSRRLAELPEVGLGDIDHVLITHLHGDHMGGLEQLLFFRRFVTGKKANLYAIPEVLAGLWDTRLRGGMECLLDAPGGTTRRLGLDDYATVVPLGPGATRIGSLSVEWRPTIHHVPTSALRIGGGDAILGYSADTAFDPTLIEWLSSADLFFHETNHGIHTPLAALVGLPLDVRRKMRLIHYPDFHDVTTSPIPCAVEGTRLVVAAP